MENRQPPRRSPLKSHHLPNWKQKLRENCYKRVREDRRRLLWKMRLPATDQSYNHKEFIKSAMQDILSDELKKIKESTSTSTSNKKMEILTTNPTCESDTLWEYDGLQNSYKGDCEEIMLEMQNIFYEELREEPTKRAILGARKHFEMTLYLAVGIQLILLVGSGSFASEAGSSYDSKDQRTLPQYDRYIMKPYFEKYDSLHDSHFQNFIKHELSFGSCEVLPGISNLLPQLSVSNRYLIGEGSHRRLSSTIRLEKQSEFVSQLPKLFCEVIIVEKLPSGVFADPFELEHLLQRGVFSDAVVFGDTNLELPSVLSNRSLVEIHMDIGSSILSRLSNGPDISIELPLHARYPPLEESGYSRVELGAPDLFMHCSSKGRPLVQSCLLMMKDDDSESRTRSVVWSVPSGIEAHARVVSVVTFVLATLSTLLIVLSSMYYSDIMSYTNLKQH